MLRRSVWQIFLVLILVSPVLADTPGQGKIEENNNEIAELKGQIFFANFDVDRAYIDIKKKLDRNASARMAFDVTRITGASRQNLFDYLKYAYVEIPVIPGELNAKFGLQQTVWIDWADKQLGLRFIAKSLLDNEGVMPSSDFGLGTLGKFSSPGLPEIEYQTTILNGNGYATYESDSNKSLAARISSSVYNGRDNDRVIAGIFANLDSNNILYVLALSRQQDRGRVFFEYLGGAKNEKSISGYSLGGVLNIGNYNIFARNDNYDPNISMANDEKNKSFYGIIFNWSKDVKFAVDLQNSQAGLGAAISNVYLHISITL